MKDRIWETAELIKTASDSNADAIKSLSTRWGAPEQRLLIREAPGRTEMASPGTSLVVQWLRIHFAMQRMQVWSLVGELRSHMSLGSYTHAPPQLWSRMSRQESLCDAAEIWGHRTDKQINIKRGREKGLAQAPHDTQSLPGATQEGTGLGYTKDTAAGGCPLTTVFTGEQRLLPCSCVPPGLLQGTQDLVWLYHKKVNFEVRNLFLPRSASALTDGIRTIVRLSSTQKLSFLEKYFFSPHIDYFYYGKIRNYTHAQKKDF